jgi:hypothetical protein
MMRLRAGVVSAALMLSAVPDARAEGAPPVVSKTVAVIGPTIIAVLPPQVQHQRDPGDTEAAAHVQFALEDSTTCLGTRRMTTELVFADQVVIRDQASTHTIPIKDLGQGVGAVLVEPGRKATVVHTKVGPSALRHLLLGAAADYWGEQACSQINE